MVVTSNILAMNANRMLGITTKDLKKRSEKLSSGYKINKSADDAAGLSISEKMRKQIRGLSQAAENIRDGISLCQVADGALNETVDILQRMNELSIQAANGTNSLNDRKLIQQEIDQLTAEIDRIANTTCFNDFIFPLRDGLVTQDMIMGAEIDIPNQTITHSRIKVDSTGQLWKIPDQLEEVTYDYVVTQNPETVDGKVYNVGDKFSIIEVGYVHPYLGTNPNQYVCWQGGGGHVAANDRRWPAGGGVQYSLNFDDIKVDTNGYLYFNSKISGDIIYFIVGIDNNGVWNGGAGGDNAINTLPQGWSYIQATQYDGNNPNNPSDSDKDTTSNGGNENIKINNFISQIFIQAGAENTSPEKIKINLVNATCKGIGIEGLSVVQNGEAEQSIDIVKKALRTVSKYRSYFGSIQNRLEHAYNINLNTVENSQYAESKIRDTDMATEMVKYSNSNILAQAGVSVLAQANQMNQSVLRLIS